MKTPVAIVAGLVGLQSLVMLTLPHLSPRKMFFGVRTGAAFRRTAAGRRVLASYRLQVCCWFAVSVALLFASGGSEGRLKPFVSLLPALGALASYV
jgi:hypothetical protein